MWNLEKWYREIYLQIRNRDTDVESKVRDIKVGKVMNIKAGKSSWVNWEPGINIYTLILCIKWITNENLLYSTGNSTQSLW